MPVTEIRGPGIQGSKGSRAGTKLRRFTRDVRLEIRGMRRAFRPLVLWGAAGAVVYLLMVRFVDGHSLGGLAEFYRANPAGAASRLAWFCQWTNRAGDYVFTLLIVIGLLCVHTVRRSAYVRRLMVGVLISSLVVAGLARVGKIAVGRARPRMVICENSGPMNCEFFTLDARYHSFPSGHSAAAAGGSSPLLMAEPMVGVPLSMVALVIGGSRVGGLYHHPSDVMAGLWLGAMFGLGSGRRLRRLKNRAAAIAGCRSMDAEAEAKPILLPGGKLPETAQEG